MIEVQGLWKEYGDQVVIENLNLRFAPGEFVTVVGASGCGKTTFLRILLGMERPTRGTIRLDGAPLADEPGPERGIVFQRYSVFPHLTVLENVLLAVEFKDAPYLSHLFGRARSNAIGRAEEMLAAVGLSAARDKYPVQLSGGMQQRLAIAQSLIREPRILLLDEPFAALDPGLTSDMHRLIRDLWKARALSVFMVTHDIQEAFELGTRLLVFDKLRHDPQAPGRYGARVTYDLPLHAEPAA